MPEAQLVKQNIGGWGYIAYEQKKNTKWLVTMKYRKKKQERKERVGGLTKRIGLWKNWENDDLEIQSKFIPLLGTALTAKQQASRMWFLSYPGFCYSCITRVRLQSTLSRLSWYCNITPNMTHNEKHSCFEGYWSTNWWRSFETRDELWATC